MIQANPGKYFESVAQAVFILQIKRLLPTAGLPALKLLRGLEIEPAGFASRRKIMFAQGGIQISFHNFIILAKSVVLGIHPFTVSPDFRTSPREITFMGQDQIGSVDFGIGFSPAPYHIFPRTSLIRAAVFHLNRLVLSRRPG